MHVGGGIEDLAATFGMNCEIHDGYNALNNVACVHLCLATTNCEFFEILVRHPPHTYNLDSLSYGLTAPTLPPRPIPAK